jgi:F0F1-type ATP synthase assembly protein I
MPETQPSRSGDTSSLWRISGMGVELVGAILGMALLGWLLDRWLGSSPKASITCLIVGVIGGGYNFVRQAQAMNRAASAKYRRMHLSGPKNIRVSTDTNPPDGPRAGN